jgi:hypothetical protein
LARQVWLWCIERNIWVTAAHVAGVANAVDYHDKASREFNDTTEWALHHEVFGQISQTFFLPEVDLFASRLNHKVEKYISWKPDPQAYAVDAFTQNWADMKFYAFPPFSLIRTHTTQNAGGVGRRDSCSSMLDHTSLVSSSNENAGCQPPITAKKGGSYIPPIQSQTTTFTTGEDEPDGLPLIRQSYQNLGFSTRSTDILISAWREGTQKQYRVYLR